MHQKSYRNYLIIFDASTIYKILYDCCTKNILIIREHFFMLLPVMRHYLVFAVQYLIVTARYAAANISYILLHISLITGKHSVNQLIYLLSMKKRNICFKRVEQILMNVILTCKTMSRFATHNNEVIILTQKV